MQWRIGLGGCPGSHPPQRLGLPATMPLQPPLAKLPRVWNCQEFSCGAVLQDSPPHGMHLQNGDNISSPGFPGKLKRHATRKHTISSPVIVRCSALQNLGRGRARPIRIPSAGFEYHSHRQALVPSDWLAYGTSTERSILLE